MSIEEREIVVDMVLKRLKPLEQKQAEPTQDQINKLYQEIYQFVAKSVQESQKSGRPPLFVLSEAHQTKLGKSSLIVMKMCALAAHRLGIKHIYFEGTAGILQVHQLFKMLKSKQPPGKDDHAMDELPVLINLLDMEFITSKFKMTALQKTEDPDSLLSLEAEMLKNLRMFKESGLVFTGALHLKGISEDPALKKKFSIFPINTVSKQYLDVFFDVTVMPDKSWDKARIDYAKSGKVTQFVVNGKLIEANTVKLLGMVDKAHQYFTKNPKLLENAESKSAPSTFKSTQQSLELAGTHAPVPTSLPKSTQAITSPTSTSGPSTSTESELTQAISFHPLETVPMTVLAQTGFWAASKLNFCENPSQALQPLMPDDLKSLTERRQQESAAELHFQKQGSSLESALHHLLGKSYKTAKPEKRLRWRNFLIDVVNGDVSDDIGKRFKACTQNTKGRQRREEFRELLYQHNANQARSSGPSPGF